MPAPTRRSSRQSIKVEENLAEYEEEADAFIEATKSEESTTNASDDSREYALLEPQLPYAPVETPINDPYIYAFYRFCGERHRIYHKKEAGLPAAELTKDYFFLTGRYGNVFRQLDRGSVYVRDQVVGKGSQDPVEILFRVFLYCVFSNNETYERWKSALQEYPSTSNFDLDRYTKILDPHVAMGGRIYVSGFQLVPPTNVFGHDMSGHAASLRLLKLMMDVGLPQRLMACKYLVDASALVQSIPTMGGFLSLNLLCYSSDSPHVNLDDRDFASCGPGSRATLQKIFGPCINSVLMEEAGLKWLERNQWRYWARLGEDPPVCPGLGRSGLSVLAIENALCWHHKYLRAQSQAGAALAPPPVFVQSETDLACRPADEPDPDDWKQQVGCEAEADGSYEIEKIVNVKNDNQYRVRWAGYPPEQDTWEHRSTLQATAKEALQDFVDWRRSIADGIKKIRKVNKFTGRIVTKGCDIEANKRETLGEERFRRSTKRKSSADGGQEPCRRSSRTAVGR